MLFKEIIAVNPRIKHNPLKWIVEWMIVEEAGSYSYHSALKG
jgi:hypothetical protein